jgi:hypothetical protein
MTTSAEAIEAGGAAVTGMFPGLGPVTGREIAAVVLTAATPHIAGAERERIRPAGEPLTHYFHCWRFPAHHACAVELIERQQREIDQMIAGLAPAVEVVAASERRKLYAELGNDHWVIFTEDGWTTEHSVECRLSGQMSSCAWHEAVRQIADVFDPDLAGRWLITSIDPNVGPALVRADLIRKDSADAC